MKTLRRDRKLLWLACYFGREKISSGEYRVQYDEPMPFYGSVSAGTGKAQTELFGSFAAYDRVILTDETQLSVDESSVLCVDRMPEYDAGGNLVYDYVVKRVSRTPNLLAIAVQRVVR